MKSGFAGNDKESGRRSINSYHNTIDHAEKKVAFNTISSNVQSNGIGCFFYFSSFAFGVINVWQVAAC